MVDEAGGAICGKDWSQTISLTSELIQFSTSFNLLLFAAIGWMYVNWKKKSPRCKRCKTWEQLLIGASFISASICVWLHYKLFLELIANASLASPNPISTAIKDNQTYIMTGLLISTVLVFLSAVVRGVGSDD